MPKPEINLREKDRKFLWHPFTQHRIWEKEEFPVIIRGNGVYLYDDQGKKYIDGVSSLWANAHGHNHPLLNKAIKDQLSKIAHSTFLGLSHPPGIILAEKLIKIAPQGLTRVFYAENGASAVEIALKMAFQFWKQKGEKKRGKFLSFELAYHGDTVGAMSIGKIPLFTETYKPLLFETISAPSPDCYRCPEKREKCDPGEWACFNKFKKIIEKHSSEIAGVFIEPMVQCAGGIIVQPKGFLKAVERICKDYGILLIADEVAVGLGRLGSMFAVELEGVEPDFIVLGKALGAGYLPISAVLVQEKIFKAFLGDYHSERTFFHGHTYTANPLACAVAIQGLELFEKEKRILNVQKRARQLAGWKDKFLELGIVGEFRQVGLLAGIELVKDKKTRAEFPPELMLGFEVARRARKKGAILRPLGNVLVLMPPLCISEKELNRLLEITLESIKQLKEKLG